MLAPQRVEEALPADFERQPGAIGRDEIGERQAPRPRDVPRHRVDRLDLATEAGPIASIEQVHAVHVVEIPLQLRGRQHQVVPWRGHEACPGPLYGTRLRDAAQPPPPREAAVENEYGIVAEPPQDPPGASRNRTVTCVVDDDSVRTADAECLQLGNGFFGVGKRMSTGAWFDRPGEICIEVEIDGARNMGLFVVPKSGPWICEIEARIDHGPTGVPDSGLEHFCDNEYAIVRQHARHHGKARETPLYNERHFWTIAGPWAIARNSGQTREQAVDKIIVGLKRVVDYNVRVQVKSDGSGVETDGVKMSINPFDEIALEEALRIRESGNASEVIALSIGPSEAQQQLRTGLAMGADRAILVNVEQELDPLSVARVFHAIAEKEAAGLVLLGKQAIDGDNSQVAQMLAALWDRPQATFASGVSIEGDTARVIREVDAGLETIEVDLPAVISVDLRLNEPRYVKLPDIMKAKKKPLDEVALSDLGVEAAPRAKELSYAPPAGRQRGIMVDDVAGLVTALKDKGLV